MGLLRGGGRVVGRGTEAVEERIQAVSMLSAEPHMGLDPMTLRLSPELKTRVRCSTNCSTQVPQYCSFLKEKYSS